MRWLRRLWPALSVPPLLGLVLVLNRRSIPLGVPGEWEWARLSETIEQAPWLPAIAALLLYLVPVAVVFRRLERAASPALEGLFVAGLFPAAVALQVAIHSAAPVGYGLEKWVTIANPGSSGYLTVASREAEPLDRFLLDYPEWIRRQDALHIGTHPPGLFVIVRWALDWANERPSTAIELLRLSPDRVNAALRTLMGSSTPPERAAVVLLGWACLLACSATVVPLYVLVRSSVPAAPSWAIACAWPLVPSAILFQPTADAAFPALSAMILALVARPGPGRFDGALAFASGLALAIGLQLTLAFLAIGLVAGLAILTDPARPILSRWRPLLCVAIGFLVGTLAIWALTGANPGRIWWANQANHARFYDEYPRSFARWALINPVELAVAIGIPLTLWIGLGLTGLRGSRISWIALLTLALLTLTGRNLSEVARLWLPFFPPLLVAAGHGLAIARAGAPGVAATLFLLGIQTIALERAIQVVYSF